MKRSVSLALCIYEVGGLWLYLYRLYEAGTMIHFSVFSISDLLVWTASPFVYSVFLLLPAVAGCFLILHRRPSGAKMLLYGKRTKLFWKQFTGTVVWNCIITILFIAVAVTAGFVWQKETLNWSRARSYFTIVTHMVLPHVRFAQVLLADFITLFLRNLIFTLILMAFWWSNDMIYGVAVVSGICFAEVGSSQIKFVIGTVSIDYGFWAYTVNKVVFAAAALVFVAMLLFLLFKFVKRKEF